MRVRNNLAQQRDGQSKRSFFDTVDPWLPSACGGYFLKSGHAVDTSLALRQNYRALANGKLGDESMQGDLKLAY